MGYKTTVPSKDEMQGNENYKFIISGSGISVSGHMQNELAIGGGNSFTDVSKILGELADLAGGVSKTVGAVIGLAKSAKAGLDAVNQASSKSKVTDFESRLIWESSEKPQFVIEYTFYNESQEYAESTKGAMSMALSIQKGVLPSKGTPAKNRPGVFFRSPLGYKPKTGSSRVAEGTLTLTIGKWFRATDLVIRNSNFVPSTQVLGNGHPVMVRGSVTLEPSELITYETFLGYFKGISVNNNTEVLDGLV